MKRRFLALVWGVALIFLAGCGAGHVETPSREESAEPYIFSQAAMSENLYFEQEDACAVENEVEQQLKTVIDISDPAYRMQSAALEMITDEMIKELFDHEELLAPTKSYLTAESEEQLWEAFPFSGFQEISGMRAVEKRQFRPLMTVHTEERAVVLYYIERDQWYVSADVDENTIPVHTLSSEEQEVSYENGEGGASLLYFTYAKKDVWTLQNVEESIAAAETWTADDFLKALEVPAYMNT